MHVLGLHMQGLKGKPKISTFVYFLFSFDRCITISLHFTILCIIKFSWVLSLGSAVNLFL